MWIFMFVCCKISQMCIAFYGFSYYAEMEAVCTYISAGYDDYHDTVWWRNHKEFICTY